MLVTNYLVISELFHYFMLSSINCEFVNIVLWCRPKLFVVDVISDASFSENFYGLRRVSRDSNEVSRDISDGVMLGGCSAAVSADTQVAGDRVRHLTRAEIRRSLFFLVSRRVVLLTVFIIAVTVL